MTPFPPSSNGLQAASPASSLTLSPSAKLSPTVGENRGGLKTLTDEQRADGRARTDARETTMNGTEGVQAQASDESEDDEEGLYRLDAEPTDAGSGGGRSEDDEDEDEDEEEEEEEEEAAEEDMPTSAPEPIVLLSDARVSHIQRSKDSYPCRWVDPTSRSRPLSRRPNR